VSKQTIKKLIKASNAFLGNDKKSYSRKAEVASKFKMAISHIA
jgi:hypothetical protein